MAAFVDGISLWVVRGCQHALDAERVHEFAPYVSYKFTTAVRQKAAGCAKVWHDMPEESFAHCACGVIARGYKDGILRITIHKHDEEFLSVVGG